MSALGPSLTTARLAWHNKGYNDGRYRDAKFAPTDEKAQAAYLKGWRIGRRERLQAQAEGRP